MNSSDHEISDPLVTCAICLHPYHSRNFDGQIEKPVITACGHVFGDQCINHWLKAPVKTGCGPTCPVCRFELKFTVCPHAIAAVDPYDPTNPPPRTLVRNDTAKPENCFDCYITSMHWHMAHRDLKNQKRKHTVAVQTSEAKARSRNAISQVVLSPELEKLLATEIKRQKEDLERIEKELRLAESHLEKERLDCLAKLKSKRVWYKQVEDAVFMPPGHPNDDASDGDDDENDYRFEEESDVNNVDDMVEGMQEEQEEESVEDADEDGDGEIN